MTERDYVARRMNSAFDKAFDIAEEQYHDRGMAIPPEIVGQMALEMYRTRMTMAFSSVEDADLPEDTGIGQY